MWLHAKRISQSVCSFIVYPSMGSICTNYPLVPPERSVARNESSEMKEWIQKNGATTPTLDPLRQVADFAGPSEGHPLNTNPVKTSISSSSYSPVGLITAASQQGPKIESEISDYHTNNLPLLPFLASCVPPGLRIELGKKQLDQLYNLHARIDGTAHEDWGRQVNLFAKIPPSLLISIKEFKAIRNLQENVLRSKHKLDEPSQVTDLPAKRQCFGLGDAETHSHTRYKEPPKDNQDISGSSVLVLVGPGTS